jgi:acyl-CoA dehydrogenase
MDFAYSPKVQQLRERVSAFMETHVYPAEAVFEQQVIKATAGSRPRSWKS